MLTSTRAGHMRATALVGLQRLGRGVARAASALLAPTFVIIGLLVSGSACAVAGVALLHGTAWALITAAAIFFVLAGLLLRGVSNA